MKSILRGSFFPTRIWSLIFGITTLAVLTNLQTAIAQIKISIPRFPTGTVGKPGLPKKLEMSGRWHQADAVYDVFQAKEHVVWDGHNILGDWSEHFEGDWKDGWLSGRVTQIFPGKNPASGDYYFRVVSANQIVRIVDNQPRGGMDRGDLGPEAYVHAQDVLIQRQKQEAANAQAAAIRNARLADLAAHPQTDLDKLIEGFVLSDSQHWMIQHYDVGTVRHTKIVGAEGQEKVLRSDYYWDDGRQGYVFAVVKGLGDPAHNDLACIRFWDDPHCRQLGVPFSTSLAFEAADHVLDQLLKPRDQNEQ